MVKATGAIKVILIFIFVAQGYSCSVNRKLSSTGQIITDRILFIPVASATILKQAATKVYALEELKDNTPVQMKNLYMLFYNQRDTLSFNFDKVTFHFIEDSLIFDEFTFPKWDVQKVADSMQCRINFLFTTTSRSYDKCVAGSFSVVKGIATSVDSLQVCR